ncbi:hypothetical protein D9757_002077 [Collybiopsis confluens]|uniref:Fumarylacetoacetase-like C-terminal domain-containing protein n=1 Tax=Collybiopsis confluens TaxID=2823264 RepID=A0A8H5MEH0_9AGAR|nr:hypothetical protein D9757_002077 [Collybiopsis confluens]
MSITQDFVKHGKKIVAIGRNYDAHIKELGNPPNAEPWFFLKPTTSYLPNGGTILIPKGVNLHHEIELGVVIGKEGKDIPRENWEQYVAGYALGIDLTARNFQQYVKAKSLPWTSAKGFDTFCPISDFVPKDKIPDPMNVVIWIKASFHLFVSPVRKCLNGNSSIQVNEMERQRGKSSFIPFLEPP